MMRFSWLLLSGIVSFAHAQTIYQQDFDSTLDHTQVIKIEEFGRYSFETHSEQGVALVLNNKKTGPSNQSGVENSQDGRIAQFLSPGEYQLKLFGHEDNTGKAKLDVVQYQSEQTSFERLVDNKLYEQSLEKNQQISFVLRVPTRQWVHLEAAGRNLETAAIWQAGQWRVEDQFKHRRIEPKEGQPLNRIRLAQVLDAGEYQITFYGGSELAWANDEEVNPFYLRKGITELAPQGQFDQQISPFGEDYYLVDQKSDYFNLVTQKPVDINLGVNSYSDSLFDVLAVQRSMTNKSINAYVEYYHSRSTKRLIVVQGEAGQDYKLQYFNTGESYQVSQPNRYFLSADQALNGEDFADTTWLIMKHYNGSNSVIDHKSIELSNQRYYQRRFNLLDTVYLLVEVKTAGSYKIEVDEVQARTRIEPIRWQRPRNYRTPNFKESNSTWQLNKGLYVVEIAPQTKGVASVNIKNTKLSANAKPQNELAQAAVFPAVYLDRYSKAYRFYNGNKVGLGIFELPYNGDAPITLWLKPGESVSLPTHLLEDQQLQLDNQNISITDQKAFKDQALVKKGLYTFDVKNTSKDAQKVTLGFTAQNQQAAGQVAAVYFANADELPQLKVNEANPVELSTTQQYQLKVTEAGLYKVQTQGLLSTQGSIRSRIAPRLATANSNGVGRNFALTQYLLPGDYRINVAPNGSSSGFANIELFINQTKQAGELNPGQIKRIWLEQQSLEYQLNIANSNWYQIEALTLDRTLAIRLDDNDGWPIIKPNSKGDSKVYLEAGSYKLTLMPEQVDARAILRVTEIVEKQQPQVTKQIHPLSLEFGVNTVEYTWLTQEQTSFEQSAADTFSFELLSDNELSIQYPKDFNAKLELNGQSISLASTLKGEQRNLSGKLKAGRYELSLKPKRKDNQLPYRFSIERQHLNQAERLNVSLPFTQTFWLSDASNIEISSFGAEDVRAELLDEQGNIIAKADDRTFDWNFIINQELSAGKYQLRLVSLSKQKNAELKIATVVSKTLEKLGKQGRIGFQGNHVQYHGVQLDEDQSLVVKPSHNETALTLQQNINGVWQTVSQSVGNTLFYLADTEASYRLRVQSEQNNAIADTLVYRVMNAKYNDVSADESLQVALNYYQDLQGYVGFIEAEENMTLAVKDAQKVNLANIGEQAQTSQSLIHVKSGPAMVFTENLSKIEAAARSISNAQSVSANKLEQFFNVSSEKGKITLISANGRNDTPELQHYDEVLNPLNQQNIARKSLLAILANEDAVIGLKSTINQQVELTQTSYQLVDFKLNGTNFEITPLTALQFNLDAQTSFILSEHLVLIGERDGKVVEIFADHQAYQATLLGEYDAVYLVNTATTMQSFATNELNGEINLERLEDGFINTSNIAGWHQVQLPTQQSKRLTSEQNSQQMQVEDELFVKLSDGTDYIGLIESAKPSSGKNLPSKIEFEQQSPWFEINNQQAISLSFSTIVPLQIESWHNGESAVQSLNDQQTIYLAPGQHFMRLHNSHALNDDVTVKVQQQTLMQLNTQADAMQPSIWVGAGQTSAVAFTTLREDAYGFGLKGENDSLTSVILNEQGEVVASGNVIYQRLPKGKFVWVISNATKQPYAVQLNAQGLADRPTTPPQDVLEQFLGAN